jgi:pimeloyl-ACP methyl ester carboxylesterase
MDRKDLLLNLQDIRGLTRLGFDATLGITSLVETMHANIAAGIGFVGVRRERAQGISGLVYRCVRAVTKVAGGGVDALLGAVPSPISDPQPVPAREALLAAVNGVLGDHLLASANPLAITMSLRIKGCAVSLTREGLAAALPKATGRVVILLHGLCMNDLQWQHNGFDYGADLAADGFTPLYLHYNTGRHISDNGRDFAALLEQLASAWPTPVTQLVLLGHSMGGLVARSACHIAEQERHTWLNTLTRMVFLGTPHHGSPLEKGGNWIDLLIGATPYTVAFTRLGRVRSAGITDLRHGYVRDRDWHGRDRFAREPAPMHVCPLPEHVRCYALAATLAKEADGKPDLIGDGLVRVASALGKHRSPSRTLAIPPEHQRVLYGVGHIDLLGHAEVLATVRAWLAQVMPADPVEAIEFRMERTGLTPKDLVPAIGRLNRCCASPRQCR